MGAFTIMITNKGKALQAKAQTGVELKYTRFRIGDGQLGGRPISDLTGLINPVLTLPITKLQTRPGGRAVVGTVMTNKDVTTGFYFRELGIYAQDPDVGEILYCYGNAGETADYIPAKGGSNIIEEPIDISTIVGNASSVTAEIDGSLVYATHDDVDASEARAKAYTDQKVKDIDLSKITPESIGAAKKSDFDTHVQDNNRHIAPSERSSWNAKESTEGSQAKANTAETNAKNHANAVASQAETNAKNASLPRTGGTVTGDLSVLNTLYVANRNVLWEIDQLKTSGVDAKNRIAGAVNAKGVPASAADDFPTLAWKIGQITTGVPMARITTSVSEYPKNFLISEGGTVNWALYYIMVTGLSFQTKGIVVLNSAFRVIAAYDFYTNQAISVDGAHYNHQIMYRDTLPQLNEYSIFATITPTSFVVPVTRYEDDSNKPVSVIVYG